MKKRPEIAVILPALNEEKSIGGVLQNMPADLPLRIIVSDNGSTDRTAEISRGCGAEVVFAPRRGYGSACLEAIRALRDEDVVVFMDADGAADPREIRNLIDPILNGPYDLVLGSRTIGNCEPGAMSLPARFGNWLAPFLIRILFGHRYTDLGPFRAIRASALKKLEMSDPNFGWTVEMQVKALQNGLNVCEVPASWRKRTTGKSKISGTARGVVGAGCKILWTIAKHGISGLWSAAGMPQLLGLGSIGLVLYLLMAAMAVGIGGTSAHALRTVLPSIMHPVIGRWETGYADFYEVSNSEVPILSFLVVFGLAFCVYALAVRHVVSARIGRGGLAVILIFAAAFRLPLLPTPLILENDIYRYLWDGKTSVAGINPYRHAPAEVERWSGAGRRPASGWDDSLARLDALRLESAQSARAFRWIGHKEVRTIYPPAAQAVFAVAAFVKPDSPLVMKSVFFLFDLGVIALIILILKKLNRRPHAVLIYAWSPPAIKEFANSGHMDVIAIFFMCLSLLLAVSQKPIRAGLALGLAVLSKLFPAVLLAPLARRLKASGLLAMALILCLGYLPFLEDGAAGRGLWTFARQWQSNAGIFALLKSAVGDDAARWSAAALLAGLALAIFRRRPVNDRLMLRGCLILIAAILFLSPAVYPWYVTWLLPLLCLQTNRGLLLFSGLVAPAYYSGFIHSRQIPWVPWVEYAAVFAVILWDRMTRKRLAQ